LIEYGHQLLKGVIDFSIVDFIPVLDKIPGPLPWRVSTAKFRREDNEFQRKLIHEAIYGEGAVSSLY
jgi:hypothetical protein